MSLVTPGLYDGPPRGCKICGATGVPLVGGICARCIKGEAIDATPASPLSVRHAPRESFMAAERISSAVTRYHQLCLDMIRMHGAMSCKEIEAVTGEKHQTISPRLHELEGKNRKWKGPVLLYRTGARRNGSGLYDLIERRDTA